MGYFRLVKGAIDSRWIAAFETLCLQWIAQFEARAVDPHEIAAYPVVARFPKQSGIPLSPTFFPQTKPPAGVEKFLDVIASLPMWRGLSDGSALYMLRDYSSIRRQRPTEPRRGFAWHQDSAVVAGQFRARGVRGYVLWVPITPIDAETPTLQIMPNWRWPLKHHSNPDNGYLESIHKPWGRIVTLEQMQHGDVALFDINCPHRTFFKSGMTKDRISVDVRVVETIPQSYRGETIQLN